MNELLERLSQPFPPEAVTWKPGNTTKDGSKCMAMAYGDLRAYMERLDELCGLDWSVRYVPWQQERIICELTINGVTRSSTGEYGTQDEKNNIEGTVAEAQAFKRACAMFGLGRYLYDLPSVWVAFDAQAKKISKEGQAELDNRYKAWYAKAIAASKQAAQNAPPTTQQAATPANGNNGHSDTQIAYPPRYADLIDKLTGDCLERANRARKLHAQGKGPATPEQYKFLAGTINAIVGVDKAHNAILEVFVGRTVNSANPPSILLAGKLLDALLEETTEEVDGEKVKVLNPNFNPDAVTCVHSVYSLIQEANGQQSLFANQPQPA